MKWFEFSQNNSGGSLGEKMKRKKKEKEKKKKNEKKKKEPIFEKGSWVSNIMKKNFISEDEFTGGILLFLAV